MLQIHRGTVKFFKKDKGWGFITPDEQGKPDVFFHTDYFSGVSEDYKSELELKFSQEACLHPPYHAPQKGEKVVFHEFHDQRGLMAVNWTYASAWAQAEKMISIRPSPMNCYVRVMKEGTVENRFRASVVWKGTDQEFRKKLDEGFPEMFSNGYYVEELNIASRWERVWHPCNWHRLYKRSPTS